MQISSTSELLQAMRVALTKLCNCQSQELSYQLTYDKVYCLCKQGKQVQLLALIEEVIKTTFTAKEVYDKVNFSEHIYHPLPNTCCGVDFLLLYLKNAADTINRICEICLFLDVNYCEKRQLKGLRSRLFQIHYKLLLNNPYLTSILMREIQRGLQCFKNTLDPIHLIKQIKTFFEWDEKEQFLQTFFLQEMNVYFKEYYEKQCAVMFKKSLREYLNYCKKQIDFVSQYIKGYLIQKKAQNKTLEFIQQIVYEQCVTNYLKDVYVTHESQLFQDLMEPMMLLLRCGKNKEIQQYFSWYTGKIYKTLKSLPVTQNQLFICSFVAFYFTITDRLKNVQSLFDLHYRSIFTFEEFLNQQQLHIHQRLNHYVNLMLTTKQTLSPLFNQQFSVIFKLMKEKDQFQIVFRRLLIDRILLKATFHQVEQQKIIDCMENQCGCEWVIKIRNIQKCRMNEQRINKKPAFTSIILEDIHWPYDNNLKERTIHSDLLNIAGKYLQDVKQKDKKIILQSKGGIVELLMKFNGKKYTYFVSTGMANILLHLADRPYTLNDYLNITQEKSEQIQKIIKKLQQQNLIIVSKGDNLMQLADKIPEDTENNKNLVNERKKYENKIKLMEQLKPDKAVVVDAILVKLMKNAKEMKIQILLEKTAHLLAKQGYNFNAQFVKEQLKKLLDKDFFRELEHDTIGYVA